MRIFWTLFLSALSFSSFAQMHSGLLGNEWINYSQDYYKMQVVQDGFYRISAQTLQNSGINPASLSPANIELYHMGKKVPVHVESNGGNIDYIEFYGKKHRGEMDVNLYRNPNHHFNPEYSVISDTAAYFLTWNNTGQSRQYAASSADLSGFNNNAEPYFMHRSVTPVTSGWQKGKEYQISTELLTKSSFEFGEGWGSGKSINQTHNVPVTYIYNSGPAATGYVRAYSAGSVVHNLDISISNNSLFTSSFGGDSVGTHEFNIPLNLLQGNTPIRVRGLASNADRNSVSYVAIEYPRQFNFGGATSFKFKMPANFSSNDQYLEITNINSVGANQNQIYLYDMTNNIRIQCFWNPSSNSVVTNLPPSNTERELVLVNFGAPLSYQTIGRVDQVNFTDYSSYNANYIIVSHSSLRQNSQGNDPVLEYAAYRASTGFNPVVVDVQELFDQFGYGINMHPVALRNWAMFCKQNWSNPEYIFIIGKGRIYTAIRNFNTFDHLIPTFGHPPSDNLLMAPLGSDVPLIPVGRLAATNADQVSTYLQKIQDLEAQQQNAVQTLENRGWMKNFVHLGGGRNSSEQNIIRQHLNTMSTTISNSNYGANVTSFFKTSANPIQAAQSAFLDSLINAGVSQITFFGHSSANSFDFNLDRPENYSNYQKYPLIMSLGCYGGTIFEDGTRISEDFIFEPDAGASVFLASVGASALSALNVFATQYYYYTTGPDYGQGSAKMVQSAINTLENGTFYSTTVQMVCQYMAYHGDPAINLNTTRRPDYYIDIDLVDHSPQTVTTQMDEFDLVLDIYNLGKAIDTSFWVEIYREFPGGNTEFVTKQQIIAPHFHDQINITVPVGGQLALGTNYFNITIDSDQEIVEEPNPDAENNNQVFQYPIQILSDAILPVYPTEFAIVPDPNVTLKASTGNTFANSQTYVLQFDTTEYFNSPLMQQTSITQAGGLVEWIPSVNYQDSTVYYWRVSPDSIDPNIGYSWASSSFIYIDGSYPGWNQSHFFQYRKDQFRNIELEEPNRAFQYVSSIQTIDLKNGFTPSPLHPEQLAIYQNQNLVDKCRCNNKNGVYVVVIDSSDANIWMMPGGSTRFGAINCDLANRDQAGFLFETQDPAKQVAMETMLRDSIPDGYYAIIYTLNDAGADNWNTSLINYIQSQGSQDIATLAASPGGLPWAFFYQKGNPSFSFMAEEIGSSQADIIDLVCQIQGDWYKGDMQSTVIGPAQAWYSFHWQTSNLDGIPTDATYVDLYGIEPNGSRTLIFNDLTQLDTSLTAIDANIYPKLELVWFTEDEPNKTSAQLDYWRILADLAPEAALRPELYHLVQYDTVQQGMPFNFEVMMQNISPIDMDSMLVRYAVIEGSLDSTLRIAPLAAGDTLRTPTLTVDTRNLNGPQQLLVEINPYDDQEEMYHFNNIALVNFYVQGDYINPLLDVTFDGVRIMNGDIVSGKTQIVISLSDENEWLQLDDSSDFKVILRHPALPNGETLLSANNPLVTNFQFLPADASNLVVENKAQLVTELDLEWDGTYTLFVSATDKSGNNSGDLDYSIDFEVNNTPMISNVLNYPNPFTTQTQFVFTLTGREIPEYMKLQIMTVTGKIVREVSMEELGPIHIGTNKTEFAWDGTDQFGDRLANGVYLYRLITRMNRDQDEDLQLYNTKASYMFRKGFGKMYLMR